jgi:CubicO group peptidase (beta-lactamase class C family)
MNSRDSSTKKATTELSLPEMAQSVLHLLDSAVAEQKLTAWSAANPRFALSSFFADECEPPLEGNCDWMETLHPTFDLASLTKPLFLNAILRRMVQNLGEVLTVPLREILKTPLTPCGEIIRSQLELTQSDLTLCDFLNHRTGVPPWTWFGKGAWHFATENNEPRFVSDCLNTSNHQERFQETITRGAAKLLGKAAQKDCYSDVGFFLLTRIAENMIPSLDWKNALLEHNRAQGTHFFHASLNPEKTKRAIPTYPYLVLQGHDVPTGAFQKRSFGNVHDTNGNILAHHGIVSGHAGLFGSVLDVLLAIPFLSQSQQQLLTSSPTNKHGRYVFGLDTPDSAASTAGPLTWPLPPDQNIFGHLGHTGTSFWINQSESQTDSTVILTNRTAHRTTYGPQSVPRVLVFTEFATEGNAEIIRENDKNSSRYFVQKSAGAPLRQVSRNDAEEIVVAHANGSTRIWNDSILRKVPNIQSLRNAVSQKLWNPAPSCNKKG